MIKPLFSRDDTNKLSLDTDDGRQNGYTSIVRANDGRLIVFYEKEWNSGRLSQSIVTTTTGLGIQVEAGNGEINGIATSWSLSTLSVPPSSYSLIYVTTGGVVSQTTDITATLVKDIVVLAFIGSGATEVSYIDMVEMSGFYIFYKRQVLSGSDWVWDDYEYRLNVGKNPTASYDSSLDRVYLSFSKDNLSHVRVFNLSNPLTWEYLPHFRITGGTIYPEKYPESTSILQLGAGLSTVSHGQIFNFSAIGVGYKIGISGVEPYVHVPYLNSAFNDYVIDGTIYCEVFEKIGEIYVLLDSFQIGKNLTYTWRVFSGGSDKLLYFGVRLKHNLYVEVEFRTDPSDYLSAYAYSELTSAELLGTIWQARCDDVIHDLKLGSGSGYLTKTSEYDQLFRSQDDGPTDLKLGSGSGYLLKTAEYDQLFSAYDESTKVLSLGAGISIITKTS